MEDIAKLNILEFNRYIQDHKPQKIIYKTELQRGYSVADTLRVDASFDTILISINPAIVFLKASTQSIRVNRVKQVLVEEKLGNSEKIFTIICGDKSNSRNDILHKFAVI